MDDVFTAVSSIRFWLIVAPCAAAGLLIWFADALYVAGIALQGGEVSGFLIGVGLFSYVLYTRTLRRMQLPGATGLGVLVIAVFLGLSGLLSSTSLFDGGRYVGRYLLGLTTVAGFYYGIRSRFDYYVVIAAYLLGALGTLLVCVAGLAGVGWTSAVVSEGGLAMGFLNNPNQLAILALVGYGLAAGIWMHYQNRSGGTGLATAVLVSTGLLVALTGSKAGIILAAGMTAAAAIAAQRRAAHRGMEFAGRSGRIVVGLTTVAVGLLALFYVEPRMEEHFRILLADPLGQKSVATRIFIWERAIGIAGSNLPFGVGFENVSYYFPEWTHVHNGLIQWYLANGIPGLVLGGIFVVLLALYAWRGWRLSESWVLGRGASLAVIGYVAENMISDSFGGTTLPALWFSLGLLFVVDRVTGGSTSRLELPGTSGA